MIGSPGSWLTVRLLCRMKWPRTLCTYLKLLRIYVTGKQITLHQVLKKYNFNSESFHVCRFIDRPLPPNKPTHIHTHTRHTHNLKSLSIECFSHDCNDREGIPPRCYPTLYVFFSFFPLICLMWHFNVLWHCFLFNFFDYNFIKAKMSCIYHISPSPSVGAGRW